jgi:hypothetical protein
MQICAHIGRSEHSRRRAKNDFIEVKGNIRFRPVAGYSDHEFLNRIADGWPSCISREALVERRVSLAMPVSLAVAPRF